VTYINTSLFTMPLVTILISRTWGLWRTNRISRVNSFRSLLHHLDSDDPKQGEEHDYLRAGSLDYESGGDDTAQDLRPKSDDGKLGLKATAKLSFQFCLLWVCTMDVEEEKLC
jgi:solute carrier family 35 protein F5